MLNERYRNDGQALLNLNPLQLDMKKSVEQKINNNTYTFEEVPCATCNENQFESLSEKGRYGLYVKVVICKNCGLVQTNPRMTQESYNEFYNVEYRKLYVGTASPTEEFFRHQYNRAKVIHRFLKENNALEIKDKNNPPFILEVGCGAGGILQYFKELGYEVKGIDLGEEYVNYGRIEKGLDLESCFLADLKLEHKPDLIIYSHVLEHLLNPDKEIAIAFEKLKDDGLLYIEVPGIRQIHNTFRSDLLRYLQNAHTYHFSLESLQRLVQQNGFKLVAGSQFVRSIFEKNTSTTPLTKIESDYDKTISYLKNMENNLNRVPFYPYLAYKGLLFSDMKTALLNFLDKIGVRKYIRKLRQ